MFLPGYNHIEKLEDTNLWTLYHARSIADNLDVMIQEFHYPFAGTFDTDKGISRNNRDERTTNGLIVPIRYETFQQKTVCIYPLFYGHSFEKRIEEQALSLKEFFSFALQLVRIIKNLHNLGWTTPDLHPANLYILEQENKLALLCANPVLIGEQIKHAIYSFDRVAYYAPEYTGRTDRALDRRTDLYSLGVIFYQMLTNALPFHVKERAQIIYSHLTALPEAPHRLNSEIPQVLSDMIVKLLAKMAEERYQSAEGLEADLEKCAIQFNKEGEVSNFQIGMFDSLKSYENVSIMYGREIEKNKLMNSYQEITQGGMKVVTIQGPSGIGKTELVNQFKEKLLQENAFYINGKFDQLKKNIPYVPIIQAFRLLIKQIISQGEQAVEKWKQLFHEKLAEQTNVITFLLPELEWITGKQQPLESLDSVQNHHRLLVTFHKFITAITDERPLIIFIDDIQWAD
ncbi:AAA family ATPase, partial [Bacillaceae bacterium Marseille-Q3522]|nr:AAA family ATPase [Bacillaceae bacterium Marseille-Q3522]